MACALVSSCGRVDLFEENLNLQDVLQEPILSLAVRGFTLFFSSSSFFSGEVNEFATGLAKEMIKGDAVLVAEQQQRLLDCLLSSKHLRLTQAEAGWARGCSCSTSASPSSSLLVSMVSAGPTDQQCSSCEGSMKRPRSLQHIAAANSTRNRILRSMSAAGPPSTPAVPAAAPHALAPSSIPKPPRTSSKQAGVSNAVYSSSSDSADSSSSSSSFACCFSSALAAASSVSRTPQAAAGGCQQGRSCAGSSSSSIPFSDFHSSSSSSSTEHDERFSSAESDPHGVPMEVDAAPQQCTAETHAVQATSVACASPAAPPPAAAAAAAAAVLPTWTDLPVEVVAQVARFLGSTVAAVMPVCMTCSSWRAAVLEDDQLLLSLTFRLGVAAPRCSSSHALRRGRASQHPRLLERAARLGNVSALVVRARLLDAAGCPDEAMRCWRRAAKAGHLEGQLLYGLALYRGTAGVAPDAEDAHLWLSRALKQVLATKPPSRPTSNSPGEQDASTTTTSRSTAALQQLPATPSTCPAAAGSAPCSGQQVGLHARVLTQAGLVLGYLAFDGEGTRTDKQEAVRFFKLAAQAGCKEAQQVLGWIFNTGQY